jgi:hypothetical protein
MPSSEYRDSKRRYRVHRIRRTVRALLGPKRKNTTLEREKGTRYYGHIWLDRRLHEAVSFLARVNGCTKKEIAHKALEAGLSRLLGDAVFESTRRAAAKGEEGVSVRPTPLARELARWAKARGFTIGRNL